MTLNEKQDALESHFKSLKSVVVAFSGGVDSTLVLAVAHRVLGDNRVLAVTARSESLAARELLGAKQVAANIGVEHLILKTDEMSSPKYRENPVNRCYHCKSELYSKLAAIAGQRNFSHIVNGINRDDLGDHRPGIVAAKEFGVLSPLSQAGFGKSDVRELSRQLGLTTAEKPAMPCLSSRVPYGQPITPEKLMMIERAEDHLLSLGFTQLRVRHHGETASIELLKEELPEILKGNVIESVRRQFQQIGFKDVTLDSEGFRSGKLNDVLKEIHQEGAKPCLKSN